MLRRPTVAGLALLAVATATVVWSGLLLPPPLWILKYGPTPGCEPTGRTWTIEGVEFVEIGPGVSRMGSDRLAAEEREGSLGDGIGRLCRPLGLGWGAVSAPSIEMPIHWVVFPRGFAIARTELTNSQYGGFDGGFVSDERSPGDDDPVNVSWASASAFCRWLGRESGRDVRLPSEAEWECACRVGGLLGFCGNGAEWVEDTLHLTYEGAPVSGEAWTAGGETWGPGRPRSRVLRGGSGGVGSRCTYSSRDWGHPANLTTFRPAFTPPDR